MTCHCRQSNPDEAEWLLQGVQAKQAQVDGLLALTQGLRLDAFRAAAYSARVDVVAIWANSADVKAARPTDARTLRDTAQRVRDTLWGGVGSLALDEADALVTSLEGARLGLLAKIAAAADPRRTGTAASTPPGRDAGSLPPAGPVGAVPGTLWLALAVAGVVAWRVLT